MPFDLDLHEAQPRLSRVRDVFSPAAADDILLYAGERVGLAAEDRISPYPPASGKALPLWYVRQRKDGTTYRSKFKSLAQQRKVMALIAQGKIPYRRTGSLGKSITSRALLAGSGLVMVSIGSNLTYAVYVIDRTQQSFYHRGNWMPIQTDIEQALPELSEIAVNAVVSEARRRLNE